MDEEADDQLQTDEPFGPEERARYFEERYVAAMKRLLVPPAGNRSERLIGSKRKQAAADAHEILERALRLGAASPRLQQAAAMFLIDHTQEFLRSQGVTLNGAPDGSQHEAAAVEVFMLAMDNGFEVSDSEKLAYDAYWRRNPKGIGFAQADGSWRPGAAGKPRSFAVDSELYDAKTGNKLSDVGMQTIRKLLRKWQCYPAKIKRAKSRDY